MCVCAGQFFVCRQRISIILRCWLVICNDFIVLWPTKFGYFLGAFPSSPLLDRVRWLFFLQSWIDSLHSMHRRNIFLAKNVLFHFAFNPFYSNPAESTECNVQKTTRIGTQLYGHGLETVSTYKHGWVQKTIHIPISSNSIEKADRMMDYTKPPKPVGEKWKTFQ